MRIRFDSKESDGWTVWFNGEPFDATAFGGTLQQADTAGYVVVLVRAPDVTPRYLLGRVELVHRDGTVYR